MIKTNRSNLLIAAIVLTACTMRTPLTGVGSLIHLIKDELALSGSVSGMITTLPLIAFAIVSPFIGGVARSVGIGKAMLLSLAVMSAGLFSRSFAGVAGFFCGTVLIGVGIAFSNVLLPSIIKSKFPGRVGVLTGAYTTCIMLSAGFASGISIPLAQNAGQGWRGALFVWIVPVGAAFLIWTFLRDVRNDSSSTGASKNKTGSLLRSPVAWSVSIYVAFQSLLYYSFVAWLPAVLQSRGLSADGAGFYATLFQWMGIPTSFVIPLLATKMKNQKLLTSLTSAGFLLGITLLFFRTTGALLAGVLLCGLATGACLSLAMCLLSLRSSTPEQTAALSGMAQSFGYAVAAVSPTLLGGIYDATASWTIPLAFLIFMTILQFFTGLKAGADSCVTQDACK